MLILTQKEVKKLLPLSNIDKVVGRVERAFSDYGKGKVQMPANLYLFFNPAGDLRVTPSYSPALKIAGTKLVNVHPKNPQQGLKTIMAVLVLKRDYHF